MTAPIQPGTEGFLARYAGLRDRLPGDPAIRAAAAEAFRRTGLPTRRDEAWKYTDLRPMAVAAFHEPLTLLADCTSLLSRAPAIDGPRLVFVDGRYREDLSTPPSVAHFATFGSRAEFGPLARADHEPLVALNTMLTEDGARIDVPAGIDGGRLHLISLTTEAPSPTASHPRHAIHLAAGAKFALLGTSLGDGHYLHNAVTEIHVAAGATLTHVRVQDESRNAFHFATLYVEVDDNGTYDGFTLNLGARMARAEMHARLAGPGATTQLNGAQLLAGMQHADFTSIVRHDAPHGTSRQTVKNVLAGRSRGVFQGRIEVARHAQKTDGYQMNQTLLLSPEAEIDSKPELEIFADDVKCSHGATVGELDAEQLFYMKSRGIPDAEARSLLVRAFLAEALEAIKDEAVRGALERTVERWWEHEAT